MARVNRLEKGIGRLIKTKINFAITQKTNI